MDVAQGITEPVNSHSPSNHITAFNNQTNMHSGNPTGNQSSPVKQLANQSSQVKQLANQSSQVKQAWNHSSQVKQAWNHSSPSYPDGKNSSHQLPEVNAVTEKELQSDRLNGKHVYTRECGRGDTSMDHLSLDANALFSGPGNSFGMIQLTS